MAATASQAGSFDLHRPNFNAPECYLKRACFEPCPLAGMVQKWAISGNTFRNSGSSEMARNACASRDCKLPTGLMFTLKVLPDFEPCPLAGMVQNRPFSDT